MKWIALVSILMVGCGGEVATRKTDVAAAAPVAVKTAKGRAIEAPIELSLTGTFAAESSATLASEVEGIVAVTPVRIGNAVSQGAAVVVLNQQSAQLRLQEALAREKEATANLKQAEARLGAGLTTRLENVPEVLSAKATLDSAQAEQRLLEIEERRAANLLKGGDVSRASYDRAKANLAMAEARVAGATKQYDAALNQARQSSGSLDGARAALESARAQTGLARKALADTTIRAPFAGYVSARMVAAGEFVNNQSKLVTIDRIQPLKLEIQVPESEASRIKPGLKVRARVQAFGEEWFEGVVANVNMAVNPNSRSFLVEARFENAKLLLKPGMFAEVMVDLGRSESRVVVPATGLDLDSRTDSNRVWTIEKGVARLKLVELAGRSSTEVQVRRGLDADAVVIVSDRAKLFDGAAVEVR
ncbi:MAG: efflux RND transporter periplasmic adaptor subunit [Acidobacteria bacterium]|nr:efflux RND transporter periplasmic adaptor subunit [Acidobacteriota bacterium]